MHKRNKSKSFPELFQDELEFDCRRLSNCCYTINSAQNAPWVKFHLEIGRHEGVVHDHHYVFVVLVDQVGAGLDVHHLHHGVGGCFNPHQLREQRDDV